MNPEEAELRTWARDATLTVFGAPQALVVGLTAVFQTPWGGAPPLRPTDVVLVVGVVGVSSVVAWMLVAMPAATLGASLLRGRPLATMVLGPTVGAAGAVMLLLGALTAVGAGANGLVALGAAAVGVVTIGPPWVAYVAVRARDRSGLGVVVATWGWCLALGAAGGVAMLLGS